MLETPPYLVRERRHPCPHGNARAGSRRISGAQLPDITLRASDRLDQCPDAENPTRTGHTLTPGDLALHLALWYSILKVRKMGLGQTRTRFLVSTGFYPAEVRFGPNPTRMEFLARTPLGNWFEPECLIGRQIHLLETIESLISN